MSYVFKLTALRDQWSGAIKKGETFTLVQNSSSPNSNDLVKMIKDRGTYKGTSSSLPSMGSSDTNEINGWFIERSKH
jgi:hypothetical protein